MRELRRGVQYRRGTRLTIAHDVIGGGADDSLAQRAFPVLRHDNHRHAHVARDVAHEFADGGARRVGGGDVHGDVLGRNPEGRQRGSRFARDSLLGGVEPRGGGFVLGDVVGGRDGEPRRECDGPLRWSSGSGWGETSQKVGRDESEWGGLLAKAERNQTGEAEAAFFSDEQRFEAKECRGSLRLEEVVAGVSSW